MRGTRSFTIPAEGKLLGVITSVPTLGTLALVVLAVVAASLITLLPLVRHSVLASCG